LGRSTGSRTQQQTAGSRGGRYEGKQAQEEPVSSRQQGWDVGGQQETGQAAQRARAIMRSVG
jgi:hypothetical protein